VTSTPPRLKTGVMPMNRRSASKLVIATIAASTLPLTFATRALAASPEFITAIMKPGPIGDRVLGRDDAPSTIIEYASFTCPHCASFHANVLPDLKANYIDTGKTKLIYRDFPLDDLALIVALLAHCVKGDAYFEFLNILYKEQSTWAAAPKNHLLKLMKQVGINEANFDKCIANQEVLNGIRWERDRAAKEFDVNSTPTIFVSGEKVRASVADVSAALDAEIASAT